MLKKMLFLAMIIAALSCNSHVNSFGYILNNNRSHKLVIPDSIFSFFYDKSIKWNLRGQATTGIEVSNLAYMPDYFETIKIFEFYKINQKQADQLKEMYRNKALYKLSEEDDYCTIIDEKSALAKYSNDLTELRNIYKKCKYNFLIPEFKEGFFEPLSGFYVSYNDKTKSHLPIGYDLYVMRYGSDNVVKKERTRKPWEVLPPIFEHGYSTGVAFNDTDPYFIYWVVAW